MKKQFKVGDTVRLKKNLKVGKMYEGYELYKSMIFKGIRTASELTGTKDIPSVYISEMNYFYPCSMLIKEKLR